MAAKEEETYTWVCDDCEAQVSGPSKDSVADAASRHRASHIDLKGDSRDVQEKLAALESHQGTMQQRIDDLSNRLEGVDALTARVDALAEAVGNYDGKSKPSRVRAKADGSN